MERVFDKRVLIIIFLCIAAALVTLTLASKWMLVKNHKVIQATIYMCKKAGGRSNFINVEAVFTLNNRSYTTYEQLSICGTPNLTDLKEKLTHLKVLAVYNPDSPFISHLLITQKSYDAFNVAIPDSLKWVAAFAECH